MRCSRGKSLTFLFGVLSPFLLLIKAISAHSAGLSQQLAHIIQSNLAPTFNTTKMYDIVSFTFMFPFMGNSSINFALGKSDKNLAARVYYRDIKESNDVFRRTTGKLDGLINFL